VHHAAIAEEFELRPSPRAQVSQAIAAVDDDWPLPVESVLRVMQQLREREMDRTAYRAGTMFMRGQHVGHIAALGDDFLNITLAQTDLTLWPGNLCVRESELQGMRRSLRDRRPKIRKLLPGHFL
jgi:hypothetical protein